LIDRRKPQSVILFIVGDHG